jgi:acetyl esterase/lipase
MVSNSFLHNFFLVLPLLLQHTSATAIRLWSGKAPNETKSIGIEVEYQDGTQMGCGPGRSAECNLITNVSVPTITPYLVTNGTGAAVVVAPGGGYSVLAITKEGEDIARMYNSIGVSAFLLKYRVPARKDRVGLPKWWAALQDAQRAVSIVRSGARNGRWGKAVDVGKIGFTGFSAGGHLCGHISVSQKRAYIQVDNMDNEKSIPDFSIFGYPWMLLPNNTAPNWGEPYSLAPEFSTIRNSHPRSFFFHNEDDPIAPVQGSLTYYSKLLSVGAKLSSLHISPKGGHGFGLCQNGFDEYEEICDWPKSVQRFIQVNFWAKGVPEVKKGRPPLLKDMMTQNCSPKKIRGT